MNEKLTELKVIRKFNFCTGIEQMSVKLLANSLYNK